MGVLLKNKDFYDLRKKVIEKDFSRMNDRQFEAVTTVNGPILILAGAGSGKTTVLVNRIACLMKYGNAYNDKENLFFSEGDIAAAENYLLGCDYEWRPAFSSDAARPWEVLAITFTNKAANELKTRISNMIGESSRDMWAGTFHSVCGKILRRFADRIGYSSNFTIYDTDDQKRVIKEILKHSGVDEKILSARSVLSHISHAKDKLITPERFIAEAGQDIRLKTIGSAYFEYQKALVRADAMDFDDMIVNTVRLFNENADVLDYYSSKFKYIMVDEYQDTNYAQYMLVRQLASKYRNICVVGDDDQSIYRFRGATIENILNFEDEYEEAKVIRLEQNYRSTANILDAANAVISHNTARKGKTLWTANSGGDKINVYVAADERSEAKYVTEHILESVRSGAKFGDTAVLYRMNAQSRSIESYFARSGVPYRVIGGNRFFDRKEIKDVISYLSVIANSSDDVRLKRIINEPKRGIGQSTVDNASAIASGLGISLYEVFKTADEFPALSRASGKIKQFCEMMDSLIEAADFLPLDELCEAVMSQTGYMSYLRSLGAEESDRVDNVNELLSSIKQYMDEDENASLTGYLEDVALISDIDSYDSDTDAVVLMTVHSAKGLEFSTVYLVGMEEGIFPGNQSIYGDPNDIEEERRLAYVAITRAKDTLHIIRADTRFLFGSTQRNLPSRFLEEVPEYLCDVETEVKPFSLYSTDSSYGYPSPVNTHSSHKTVIVGGTQQKTVGTGNYSVGERVSHKTFGNGTIIGVTKMSTDQMIEIEFDNIGKKKLMANFAKLTKI